MHFKIDRPSDNASTVFTANRTVAAGFTAGEKKIDELRSEGKCAFLSVAVSGCRGSVRAPAFPSPISDFG